MQGDGAGLSSAPAPATGNCWSQAAWMRGGTMCVQPRTGGFNQTSEQARKELWSIIALRSYLLLAGAKWERNAFKVGQYRPMSVITYENDPENNTWGTWYARRDAQNAHFLTEPRTTRASYEFIFLKPPTSVYTSNNSQLALLMHCNLRDTLSWILARIALAWMVLQYHSAKASISMLYPILLMYRKERLF